MAGDDAGARAAPAKEPPWHESARISIGNNITLCLDVDSRDEAGYLYGALSEGGSEGPPMADMPWGSYWGVILDRYGIGWMVNHTPA